jgi:hypothetical protein
MASLRYTSDERHLWKKIDDTVEIFPTDGHWRSISGLDGTLGSDDPLDELSFLFFLRTLPLAADTELTFSRHFDEAAIRPSCVSCAARTSRWLRAASTPLSWRCASETLATIAAKV